MAEERKTGGRSKSSGSRSSRSGQGKSRSRTSRTGANGSKGGSSSEERILGTAPSSPDIRKLHLMEPSEEAKAHEASPVDAMGQDKRRQVVGHSYGPSRRSQVMFFVAVGVVLVVIIGGWLSLVAVVDKAPTEFNDEAPWSATAANPELVAEQNAAPRSPLSPCGEPGSEYPVPAASPCAPPSKANGLQGTSPGQ